MAIELIFGMTETGKSFCANKIRERYPKSIVFDPCHCFRSNDGLLYVDPNGEKFVSLFHKALALKSYQIVVRPGAGKDVACFRMLSHVVHFLGAVQGKYEDQKQGTDRVLFVIDEADKICTATWQPIELKMLTNYGRHFSIDMVAISRVPQRIHIDLRANASSIRSFFLQEGNSLDILKNFFNREGIEAIRKLKPHHHLLWRNTGKLFQINPKGAAKEFFSMEGTE